ncbi:DNA polymerase zeta subunit, partial [Monoraphidium neglectum]
MAELADSIVQTGRQTLENAIRLVESHPDWRARVVYGDTDSLFVLLPGRTREQAFKIGNEIAEAVTAANPRPVTLRLDKIYHPCVLQTKKRYVGFLYESPAQAAPVFDAKGIETVRRDGCPAVSKMLESVLRVLFSTADLSLVRSYCARQWAKILANRVSLQDFVFCKEVRLGTYSVNAATLPPAAVVAARAMAADPRAEPRHGERVPYVVVYGEPNARLVDLAVAPHALLASEGRLRLNGTYYITRQA